MLLSVRGLSVEYREIQETNRSVNDVDLDIPRGAVVGLVGESGCGKSTVALALLGLTRGRGRIVAGRVEFEGRDLLSLREDDWRDVRGKEVGLIVQNPRAALNPIERVGRQIAARYGGYTSASDRAARQRAVELLELVGINDPKRRANAFPHELSGGMAQRVLIGMALSSSPRLLIADEPTTALDVTIQAQILDLLARLCREREMALLMITHDMGIVANYCDYIYMMNAGEIVEHAPRDTFFEQARHPASIALLAAQGAAYDYQAVRLRGLSVDTRRLPQGCFLHRRCPFASRDAGCETSHPALTRVSDGHGVRCHRAPEVRILAAEMSRPGDPTESTREFV